MEDTLDRSRALGGLGMLPTRSSTGAPEPTSPTLVGSQVLAASSRQVVEGPRTVAAIDQALDEMRADESGPPVTR